MPQRADYHPEVDTGVHVMMVLDRAAKLNAPLPVRWACVAHDLGKGTTAADVLPRHIGHEERSVDLARAVQQRLRVPSDCAELALLVAAEHGNIHRSSGIAPAAVVRLLERCDAFRKPDRFADALLACQCDAQGRLGLQEQPYPQREQLLRLLAVAQSVSTKEVAANAAQLGKKGAEIGAMVHEARCRAVAQAVSSNAA